MADTMRWRYGDTNPVVIPVDSATTIEIGDLLYLNTDDARNAAALAYNTNLATTQEDFHDLFLGVAMQRSPSGDSESIRVATTGVFEFACASATFEVGALVGADDNAGGTALEDQQVIAVATENLAVGRVAKRVGSADTKVLVDIVATVSHGGPQAKA
jgi:hypothetical protein